MLSGKEPLYVSAPIHRAAHGPTPGIRLPTPCTLTEADTATQVKHYAHGHSASSLKPAEEAEAPPAGPGTSAAPTVTTAVHRPQAEGCTVPKSPMAASSFSNMRPFPWWLPSAQGGSSGLLRHLGTGAASGNPLRRDRDQDHNQGAGAGQLGSPHSFRLRTAAPLTKGRAWSLCPSGSRMAVCPASRAELLRAHPLSTHQANWTRSQVIRGSHPSRGAGRASRDFLSK